MKARFEEKAIMSQQIKKVIAAKRSAMNDPMLFALELECLDVIAVKLAHLLVHDISDSGEWRSIAEYCNYVADRIDERL